MKAILFTDETRWQHFYLAVPIGLVFTILCVLGVASGMAWSSRTSSGVAAGIGATGRVRCLAVW